MEIRNQDPSDLIGNISLDKLLILIKSFAFPYYKGEESLHPAQLFPYYYYSYVESFLN